MLFGKECAFESKVAESPSDFSVYRGGFALELVDVRQNQSERVVDTPDVVRWIVDTQPDESLPLRREVLIATIQEAQKTQAMHKKTGLIGRAARIHARGLQRTRELGKNHRAQIRECLHVATSWRNLPYGLELVAREAELVSPSAQPADVLPPRSRCVVVE
jgi:hypothetical protein